MLKHRQVKSALRIAQEIADLIETARPDISRNESHCQSVSRYNGIVAGRGDISPEVLMLDLKSLVGADYAEKAAGLCADIEAFLTQKRLLTVPWSKAGSKEYKYGYYTFGSETPLKIINQRIYDSAVKNGFPPNFFRESYFDGVVFYAIPENTDFCFSHFRNCQFLVCRIWQARFDGANFDDTEFHSVDMRNVTFYASSIVHTRIYDSSLVQISFQKARMKSCNTINSKLDSINFLNATLNGCSYGGLTVEGTRHLDTATITMGGATNEECDRNRASIFRELGVVMPKNCKLCKCQMVWENPHVPGYFHASSSDMEDWPICRDCMIEHCIHTNCYACGYGKYPACRFLDMKKHYTSES